MDATLLLVQYFGRAALRQPGNQKDENYPFILFFSLPFVNYIHIRKPADV